MASESLRDIVLTKVDSYLTETGLPPTALGERAIRDSHFVKRLRERKNIGITTCQRVLDYIAAARSPGAQPDGGVP